MIVIIILNHLNIFLVLLKKIFGVLITQYITYGIYLEIGTKIELLNDFDIFIDEDTDEPLIIMNRLNDFLLTIGEDTVEYVYGYKNI